MTLTSAVLGTSEDPLVMEISDSKTQTEKFSAMTVANSEEIDIVL